MTEEQLKVFSEKVKAVTSLQEKLKAVGTPDGQIAINDAIPIAKEAGFEISASDLAVKEDLTEEQPEAVTWGNKAGHAEIMAYGVAVSLTQGLLLAMNVESEFSEFKGAIYKLYK